MDAWLPWQLALGILLHGSCACRCCSCKSSKGHVAQPSLTRLHLPCHPASSPFASCVAAEHWADTASSNWGAAGGKGDVHPALLQAFAWLDACQPGKAAELA